MQQLGEKGRGPLAKDRCPNCGDLKMRVSNRCQTCERTATTEHGIEAMYTQGCRCDLCREAAATARRRRRHRDMEAYRAYQRDYKRDYRAKRRDAQI